MYAWFAGVVVVAALADAGPSCGSKHPHGPNVNERQVYFAKQSADDMCNCADHKDRACGGEAATRYQAPRDTGEIPTDEERAGLARETARYQGCAARLGIGSGSGSGSGSGAGAGAGSGS